MKVDIEKTYGNGEPFSRVGGSVGGYLLLCDLSPEEIEALKTLSRIFRYKGQKGSFRLIFKEPQSWPDYDKPYGSIGWRVSFGGDFDPIHIPDEIDAAYDLEDRVREIE